MCAEAFQYQADLDVIKDDVFGESVRYRPHGGGWSATFNALIEEDLGGEVGEAPPGIGMTRQTAVAQLYITVSKTNVTTVTELKDVIEARGREYTVTLIDEEDPGAWRLYCVR